MTSKSEAVRVPMTRRPFHRAARRLYFIPPWLPRPVVSRAGARWLTPAFLTVGPKIHLRSNDPDPPDIQQTVESDPKPLTRQPSGRPGADPRAPRGLQRARRAPKAKSCGAQRAPSPESSVASSNLQTVVPALHRRPIDDRRLCLQAAWWTRCVRGSGKRGAEQRSLWAAAAWVA